MNRRALFQSRLLHQKGIRSERQQVTNWRMVLVLLVGVFGFTKIPEARAAIASNMVCTSEPDPGSSSSPVGAKCQPLMIGPWYWQARDLGYNFVLHGKFRTQSALVTAINDYLVASTSWCDVVYQGSEPDTYSGGSDAIYGVENVGYFVANYSRTAHKPDCTLADLRAKIAAKEAHLAKDQYDLYNKAYWVNPGGDLAGKGTFYGHMEQVTGLRVGLTRKIAEARAMGCL
jgi:hypothetical protein